MRRRLYFIMPDLPSARRMMDDLLLARIEERHIHVLARRGEGRLEEVDRVARRDQTAPLVGGVLRLLGERRQARPAGGREVGDVPRRYVPQVTTVKSDCISVGRGGW